MVYIEKYKKRHKRTISFKYYVGRVMINLNYLMYHLDHILHQILKILMMKNLMFQL